MMYRQGDVLLIRIDTIPAGAEDVTPTSGPLVLKHGEVTGHRHRFEDAMDARMFRGRGGAEYLEISGIKLLIHEEHSTVTIPPGKYLMPRQVEYTPAELRSVVD